ncbi:hypothetical protein [Anaerosphaera multitolerans]|uniref:Uncharacterized protein n=1 Tax=Anaerosphaera multitolerans TaxID=2487351 RepID=A0A437S6M5_9FIRM|nr:hypothetical protein [Anaerosphaera multitolerans]RVU54660.1 hypothetical protein EF514_06035 [Anaerosphaera multitolerans]
MYDYIYAQLKLLYLQEGSIYIGENIKDVVKLKAKEHKMAFALILIFYVLFGFFLFKKARLEALLLPIICIILIIWYISIKEGDKRSEIFSKYDFSEKKLKEIKVALELYFSKQKMDTQLVSFIEYLKDKECNIPKIDILRVIGVLLGSGAVAILNSVLKTTNVNFTNITNVVGLIILLIIPLILFMNDTYENERKLTSRIVGDLIYIKNNRTKIVLKNHAEDKKE